jgi:predicted DNA-binding helix-hairpin-helix protein
MRLAGIFVSSGVLGGADNTMERILDVGRALRGRGYRGYIHLKVIPGASDAAIAETVALADAVSINLEAPGEKRLAKICGAKNYADGIIRPMKTIHRLISEIPTNRKKPHATTQFIVGASDENDYELVRHMDGLYNRLNLHRVYFSAYQRGLGRSDIPGEKRTDNDPGALITREHRLYQADFLMRKYNFGGNEIPMTDDGFLRLDKDPKEVWAETHPDFFPVNLNSAEREELLRVPGLGPKTVAKILRARKSSRLESPEDAGLSGAGLAKAKTYLEPSGKNIFKGFQHDMEQLTLFE